jgi:hypothetical protein
MYYPEFFNGMLKLRNYLYFFLTEKRILKSGIFLSNFFIIKYNKIYIINIYIYHIDFEKLSFESVNRLYSSFFSYNRNNKIRKINNYFKLFVSNIDIFFFLIFFYKIFNIKKKKKKKKIFLSTNLFFKSNDFKNYYKNLLIKSNELIINRLSNLNFLKSKELELESKELELESKELELESKELELESKELELEKLKLLKLNNQYEYNILINYNNFLLKNKYYKEYVYKTSKLNLKFNNYENKNININFNFTLFEFIIFLLKKIGFNFKSKIFDKILKLKFVISLLSVLKYLNYKFMKIKINYNFLIFFLVLILKSVLINVSKKNIKNNMRNKVYFLLYNYLGYKFFFKEFKIIISFLNNIFFILNKIKNISYRFFFLSNKNITAR